MASQVQRGCRIKPAKLAHSGVQKRKARTGSASARLKKVRPRVQFDGSLNQTASRAPTF
jgi:hypothetical protein